MGPLIGTDSGEVGADRRAKETGRHSGPTADQLGSTLRQWEVMSMSFAPSEAKRGQQSNWSGQRERQTLTTPCGPYVQNSSVNKQETTAIHSSSQQGLNPSSGGWRGIRAAGPDGWAIGAAPAVSQKPDATDPGSGSVTNKVSNLYRVTTVA